MFNFKDDYLVPNKAIEATIEEFADYFAYSLADVAHRTILFEEYQTFVQAFSEQITPNFEVWIGGSFTSKKEFPNDVDLVVFADYKVFQDKEKEFEVLKLNHNSGNKRLDIYRVEIYPKEHKRFSWYKGDKLEWLHFFTNTKKRKSTGKSIKRGFIKITYHE